VDAGPSLCGRCHDLRAERWQKVHADAGAEGLDCLGCHDMNAKKAAKQR